MDLDCPVPTDKAILHKGPEKQTLSFIFESPGGKVAEGIIIESDKEYEVFARDKDCLVKVATVDSIQYPNFKPGCSQAYYYFKSKGLL